jgi:hypothetical protein
VSKLSLGKWDECFTWMEIYTLMWNLLRYSWVINPTKWEFAAIAEELKLERKPHTAEIDRKEHDLDALFSNHHFAIMTIH